MTAIAPDTAVAAYSRGLSNLTHEHGFEPLDVEGHLPTDLHGCLYLNGPGLFSLFDRPYKHWFDGDGAMTAVRFGAGGAQGAVRLVQSQGLRDELAAGRPLYNAGATLAPQWHRRLGLRFKNVANTRPMLWNERLFALYEAGLPTEVDPETLLTLGETDLQGALAPNFCAHSHEVPSRRAFYNFSLRRGPTSTLHLYEFPAEGAVRCIGTVPLPRGVTMLHDFIATENHLVFFIPPVRMRPLPVLAGLKAPLDALYWRPGQGTTVLVVPIDAPQQARRFETDAFFQYHFMNAFERGNDIVVDFVHVSDFVGAFSNHMAEQRGESFPTKGRLYRAVVQPRAGKLSLEQRWSQPCEFPQVAPAVQGSAHRFGYVLTSREGQPPHGFAKVDTATGEVVQGEVGAGQFPCEAVFVPRPGAATEDDGYLVSLAYDAPSHRSCAVVCDARDASQGPLARAWFSHHIPRPLHGTWRGV